MPQYSTVTLADGQATPVNHSFSVQSVKPDLISCNEKLSTTPFIGWPELVVRHRAPLVKAGPKSVGNGVFREEFTIKVPQMDATSPSTSTGVQPQPTVGFVNQVKLTFLISERATEAQKKDLRKFAQNLLSNASVAWQIENSEGIWA